MDTSFCQDCNNLMYPKEDAQDNSLYYACNSCKRYEYSDPTDKKANTVEFVAYNYRTKGEVYNYIAPGLSHDPSLPRDPTWVCSRPDCGNVGAVYLQLPDRIAPEAMVLVYACTECNFFVTKGKENHELHLHEESQEQEEVEEELADDLSDQDLFGEVGDLMEPNLDEGHEPEHEHEHEQEHEQEHEHEPEQEAHDDQEDEKYQIKPHDEKVEHAQDDVHDTEEDTRVKEETHAPP